MNADETNLPDLERQLELATAAEPANDASLEPETAALREGWALLGQLLQDAEAESPSGVAWESLSVSPPTPLPPARRAAWKRPVAIVVAASLLVGVTLVWSWWRTPAGGPVAKQTNTVVDLAWDEPIDTEIAQAKRQLLAVEQEWCYLSNATYPVYGRMQQIEQEMSEGSM